MCSPSSSACEKEVVEREGGEENVSRCETRRKKRRKKEKKKEGGERSIKTRTDCHIETTR